eukprot:TRINITY_DN8244_c0_g1_i2.p1 TRINITY_DN8244_c0_g1~~TRINITY_DN8244_c0_g1_i2.p1  ORF type:complete len:214 (-),score=12.24 TRINITY_DN8244_c0_g1_i2:191-832(-)
MSSNANEASFDFSLKILILGDAGCGKSALLQQEAGSLAATDKKISTISIEEKEYKINDYNVLVQYFDLPGNERFQKYLSRYLCMAAGVVLVFDVCHTASFERLQLWVDKLQEHGGGQLLTDGCVVLVGNKSDQPASLRQVSQQEASLWAQQQQLHYVETSAITCEGVFEMFSGLVSRVMEGVPSPFEPSLLLERKIKIGQRLASVSYIPGISV